MALTNEQWISQQARSKRTKQANFVRERVQLWRTIGYGDNPSTWPAREKNLVQWVKTLCRLARTAEPGRGL